MSITGLHLATRWLPGDAGATLLVCLPSQGGLMSHCFSCRVTCLCAQFEAVLQHGLKRSRGLALTAAAIKQAAGFSSKTETGTVRPDAAWRALSFLLRSLYVFVVRRAATVGAAGAESHVEGCPCVSNGRVWRFHLNEVILRAEFSEPHVVVPEGFGGLQPRCLSHHCRVAVAGKLIICFNFMHGESMTFHNETRLQ